ncbi:hypothetical protein DL96DRAFT_1743588 [Flagelloscypha sp. PMI_526]|nr:hypothetical protein DL96DRAFT_1743588 [Flagelloscypha sp. PMI_526]
MVQAVLPSEVIQSVLPHISPYGDRSTWKACCLVNSFFRLVVQPRGFESIALSSSRDSQSKRFLALLRCSEHIRPWVQKIDIALNHEEGNINCGAIEAEVLHLLPSLKILHFSTGFYERDPRAWDQLHPSLRSVLCEQIFPMIEHLFLKYCASFPAPALLSAKSLRSLQLYKVTHRPGPIVSSTKPGDLSVERLVLDKIVLEQAVDRNNPLCHILHRSGCLSQIRSLWLLSSPHEPQEVDFAALLLRRMRENLVRLEWYSIPWDLHYQFQQHRLLCFQQYPSLEHLILGVQRDDVDECIPWLVSQLTEGFCDQHGLKSLTFKCEFGTYSREFESPWEKLDSLYSLKQFHTLAFTWIILPSVSIYQQLADELPQCHQRKILWFDIAFINIEQHIREIRRVLGEYNDDEREEFW